MVRCLKQIRKDLKGFLSETDPALVPIVHENGRSAILTECRAGETPDIPAIAQDMEGHERDNRMFGTMQTACEIETGADNFLL
jgi:hypothetical protein